VSTPHRAAQRRAKAFAKKNVTRRTGSTSNTLAGIADVDEAIRHALKYHVWHGPAWGDPEGRLLYGRKSNDEHGDPVNVDAQLHDWVQQCDSDGVPVAGIFADPKIGASEYTNKPRPGFDAMVEAVATANGHYVCQYNLDRLTRRNDQLDLLIKHRAVLCQLKGKALDLSDADDQFQARLMVSLAQREAQVVHRRVTRTLDQRKANGVPHAGGAGFGFRDGVIYPAEARIVRQMVEQFLTGRSLRDIGTWMQNKGVAGRRGSTAWSVNQVRKILASPRMAGYFLVDDVPVKRHDFVAKQHQIVPLETWQRVRALLTSRGEQGRGVGPRKRNEWSGVLHCGNCGTVMHYSSRSANGTSKRMYRCTRDQGGCGSVSIVGEDARETMLDLVFARVDNGKVASMLRERTTKATASDTRKLVTDIRDLERDLAGIAKLVGPRGYTPAQGAEIAANYRDELEAKRKQLARASGGQGPVAEYLGQPGALAAAWPTLTVDQRHAIIGAALGTVYAMPVGASNRYDPERIVIADELPPRHRLRKLSR
jgi:DNA invertase Pin-like site-specific DNA recombinase